MQYFTTCVTASLPQEGESSVLGMPGRGKRVNSTAKTIVYNVYKYFEREREREEQVQRSSEIDA